MTHEDTAAAAKDVAHTAPELHIARKVWLAGVEAYDPHLRRNPGGGGKAGLERQ